MILTRSRGRCPPLPHPEERRLGRVNLSTARRDYEEGHHPTGSMGPKIEATICGLGNGDRRVVVGHLMSWLLCTSRLASQIPDDA